MPDLTALQQYTVLVDELVLHAEKEDLAEYARLLAMNALVIKCDMAHCRLKSN